MKTLPCALTNKDFFLNLLRPQLLIKGKAGWPQNTNKEGCLVDIYTTPLGITKLVVYLGIYEQR